MTFAKAFLAAALCAALPLAAAAQELTFGAGATDYPAGGRDSSVIDLGYRHSPFFERGAFSTGVTAALVATGEGDVFAGVGVGARWDWTSGWFVDLGLMPGVHKEGVAVNDLGSSVQFRSLLGVGYRFDNGRALSLAITHISNAGLTRRNPGAETLILRYHVPL